MTTDTIEPIPNVSADRVNVTVTGVEAAPDAGGLAAAVADALEQLGVNPLPPLESIQHALEAHFQQTGSYEEAVVAQGQAPTPSEDGRIEWGRDFFSTGFAIDPETQQVDYRRRTGNPAVKAGEFLARIVPPQPGEDGVDVFGEPIEARKPREATLRAGAQVRHEPTENTFYAETDGRVRCAGAQLAVDTVYTVNDSIGLKTGHVHHPGALIIHKDVLEDAQITAAGDIEVYGIVEPSAITAGGNLVVRGGITGDDEHRITVGGGLHARYILEANVDAEDDVVAEREIRHSVIRTRGAVKVTRGRLVGGEVSALGGMEVHEAGSDGDVRTVLEAGRDPWLTGQLDKIEAEIQQWRKHLEKIDAALKPIRPRLKQLPAEKQKAVEQLMEQEEVCHGQIAELQAQASALKEDSNARRKPEVVVTKQIHSDTVLRLESETHRLMESYPGPVKAMLRNGNVVFTSVRGR